MSDSEDFEDYTKQKQQYLRTNIIQVGYDPVNFTDFMQDQREDGEDIDNWSFTSLQEMVQKYVRETAMPTADIDSDEEGEEEVNYVDSSDEEVDPLADDPIPEPVEKIQMPEIPQEQEPEPVEVEVEENVVEEKEEVLVRERSNAETHMIEEPELVHDPSSDSIPGFKNIPEEKEVKKPSKESKKSKSKKSKSKKSEKSSSETTDAVQKILEEYQADKIKVNDFTGRAKTREIRMPTELTNARNLNVKVLE